MSSGVKVFVCLPARICSCFQLALVCAPALVLQTLTVSVGLGVFSSLCPTWSLCPHCSSISEMTWGDSESCLLGLTWQREPGTHCFHSLLLQVCSPAPWEEHWDSQVFNQCRLKDYVILKHGKEASKMLVLQEATLMRPQKTIAGRERVESDCHV